MAFDDFLLLNNTLVSQVMNTKRMLLAIMNGLFVLNLNNSTVS